MQKNTTRNVQKEHADDVPSSSKFQWKIENISKLNDENRFSPIFKIGPHKWRLLAFRRGCNTNGYLSIYVVAIECKEWQFVKFSLSVVDQTNNKNTLRKDTEDMFRFTKDESDWGFDEFIQLKELKDPSNGYIVNDACITEVEFCLDSIQDFKEELVPMEHMEFVEERDLVTMSTQQCDSHRKLDKKINKQLADKVSVAKFQEKSFCIETTASTSTLLANTSVCLDYDSDFICAFCQTSTVSKGSGSMLHIANGEEVKEDEVSAGPNVIHVHRKCVELTPRVYYVGKTVMNLELELTRVSKIKCCCCGLKGAALGCFMRSCKNAYHVPCAFDTSGCRWDDEGRLMLCPSHSGAKFSHEKTKKGKFLVKDNSSAIQRDIVEVTDYYAVTEDQYNTWWKKKSVGTYVTESYHAQNVDEIALGSSVVPRRLFPSHPPPDMMSQTYTYNTQNEPPSQLPEIDFSLPFSDEAGVERHVPVPRVPCPYNFQEMNLTVDDCIRFMKKQCSFQLGARQVAWDESYKLATTSCSSSGRSTSSSVPSIQSHPPNNPNEANTSQDLTLGGSYEWATCQHFYTPMVEDGATTSQYQQQGNA